MEELYGILIDYEMRIGQDRYQKKEAYFKASMVAKKSKTNIQSEYSMMKKHFLLKILREVLVSTKGNYP